VASASDALEVNPRLASGDGPYPKVTMGDVNERSSHVIPSATVERPSGSRFERDDVLLARITPCLENGKTALVKFLEPDEIGVGSTEFAVLRGRRVGPAFVYCAARSEHLREHAVKSMSGASGRQRIASNCFDTLRLVEPSALIASRFEVTAQPMLQEVYERRLQSDALAATRDLLLPRLVTGRLDTSDIDLGELLPAAAA
jgi:type I restriction enzyme S subunit